MSRGQDKRQDTDLGRAGPSSPWHCTPSAGWEPLPGALCLDTSWQSRVWAQQAQGALALSRS